MSVLAAMQVLAGVKAGDRREAAELLHDAMRKSAQRQRPAWPAARRDDAVDEALYRLLARLDRGPLRTDDEAGARSYLRMVVRSALVDDERRRRRAGPLVQPEDVPAPEPDETYDALLAEARALGPRVLAEAVRRFPRARASLEEGFAEIVRLAEGAVTVASLVGSEDVSDDLRRRNALYKRHERTRRRLLEALRALEAEGALSEREVWLARGYLFFLGANDRSAAR